MIPEKAKDILERLHLNDDINNYEFNYLIALLSLIPPAAITKFLSNDRSNSTDSGIKT